MQGIHIRDAGCGDCGDKYHHNRPKPGAWSPHVAGGMKPTWRQGHQAHMKPGAWSPHEAGGMKPSFCNRNYIMWEQIISVTEIIFCDKKKFLSQKIKGFAHFVTNLDKQIYTLSRNILKIQKWDNGITLFCGALLGQEAHMKPRAWSPNEARGLKPTCSQGHEAHMKPGAWSPHEAGGMKPTLE